MSPTSLVGAAVRSSELLSTWRPPFWRKNPRAGIDDSGPRADFQNAWSPPRPEPAGHQLRGGGGHDKPDLAGVRRAQRRRQRAEADLAGIRGAQRRRQRAETDLAGIRGAQRRRQRAETNLTGIRRAQRRRQRAETNLTGIRRAQRRRQRAEADLAGIR